jgi:hypothetical protein
MTVRKMQLGQQKGFSKTNLRLLDSSVSNIIANLIPTDGCIYVALLYLARGITNGDGLVLKI